MDRRRKNKTAPQMKRLVCNLVEHELIRQMGTNLTHRRIIFSTAQTSKATSKSVL